jgi:hypothetical protein
MPPILQAIAEFRRSRRLQWMGLPLPPRAGQGVHELDIVFST